MTIILSEVINCKTETSPYLPNHRQKEINE